MRVLFLTNFYPPHELGGQGRSCQQVVEGLKTHGHETAVLTSMQGTNGVPVVAKGIYRSLYLEMDLVPWRHSITFFTHRKRREKHNLDVLEHVLAAFEPDIVFVCGMWNLSWSLPALVEARCPGRVVYRFADYWPTLPSQHELYWRTRGRTWFARLIKRGLGRLALKLLQRDDPRPALKFEHAVCVSRATRDILVQAGIPVSNACIIYTGIDVDQYLNGHGSHSRNQEAHAVNLLYAGRLSADKGVDTCLRAMARLKNSQSKEVALSVAGSGSAEYEAHLRQIASQEGLDDRVTFLGQVPNESMPSLLQEFDVLLVPSTWPEPFARTVLEGMASGLVVVATSIGGTSEIVRDGENGLLFAPDDASELAQKIDALAADQVLRRQLASAGQQAVRKQFTANRMLDEYENYLRERIT